MTLYAGDVGAEVLFPMTSTGSVDATTITSVEIVAVGPGGSTIELPATISAATTSSITARHVTTGTLSQAGSWRVRLFYYAGASRVMTSLETTINVSARRVPEPT